MTFFLAEKTGIVFDDDEQHAEDAATPRLASVADAEITADPDIENLPKAELDALLKEELDALEDLLGDN